MWSIYFEGKETDFSKGIADGEAACRFKKSAPGFYRGLDHTFSWIPPYSIDNCLRKGQELYFEYLEKENKTAYEKGFFEGVKLFLNAHREEYYLREYAKISPSEFENVVNLSNGELPAQELISSNKGRRGKKVNIEWTEEDDKLIYSAVKKYTRDFTSLPGGYNREDVLQEAAQAWAKRLKTKGGHDPAKGKKSTLLYRVVQNTIQDLIKAANTDKRKIIQHEAKFEDIYSEWGRAKTNPAGFENMSEQYNGGESKKNLGKGDFEPTKRGTKDSIKRRREAESNDAEGRESEE